MPRYVLDQNALLRLVVLACGVDTAKPDEAMSILRQAQYLEERAAPQTLAPAPVDTSQIEVNRSPIADGSITRTTFADPDAGKATNLKTDDFRITRGAFTEPTPVTGSTDDDADAAKPAKPE